MASSISNPSSALAIRQIEDLQDNINLYEVMLASLDNENDSEVEERRQGIRKDIRSMQKKVNRFAQSAGMEAVYSNLMPSAAPIQEPPSEMESYNSLPYPTSTPRKSEIASMDAVNDKGKSPSFSLPSRKRPRTGSDAAYANPIIKNPRATPSPAITGPATPNYSAASGESPDTDDSFLGNLLPGFSREEHEREMQYLQELEERRRQEKEDEFYARLLQEEFSATPSFTSQTSTQNKPSTSSSAYAQALLKPDGTLRHAPAGQSYQQPPQALKPPSPPQRPSGLLLGPSHSNSYHSGYGTPLTVSDDSDIEEIGFQQIQQPPFSSSSSYQPFTNPQAMPGSFPSLSGTYPGLTISGPSYPGYASLAGSSVYSSMNNPYQAHSVDNRMTTLQQRIMEAFPDPRARQAQGLDIGGSKYSALYSKLYERTFTPEETEKDLKALLSHIRPDEELTPEQRSHVPDGLKVTLMPHQCTGLAWMKKMEESTNKGGILADDMGLGKTIQAIALMLSNPPPSDKHRPNLVVAPVALVQQWKREIEKMVLPSHRLSIKIMHGSGKATSWQAIKHYDVIITTYGTLAVQFGKKTAWDNKAKLLENAVPTAKEEHPLLSDQSKFHRVFLDEAQWIKNRNTRNALAACHVNSTYRWCLTGTPMQNNVDELYSLIRFCRIKPYSTYEKFSKDFSRPLKRASEDGKERAMIQLQALLKAILLRRNKDSKIDGKPILQLPDKNIVEERVPFSDDELKFYQALEKQSQIQFNKYLQRGSIGRNYSHALVLLLRLRQCCCHPRLITQSKDFMQTANAEGADFITNAKALDDEVVKRLKEIDAFECPICMDANENPALFPCGHALCNECLSQLTDQALSNPDSAQVKCPHCRAVVDAMKITDLTSFLRVHCPEREGVEPLGDKETEAETETSGADSDSDSDSDDDDEDDLDDGGSLKDFIVADDLEESEDEDNKKYDIFKKSKSQGKSQAKKKRKSKKKGKKVDKPKSLADLRKEAIRNKSAKKKYLKRLAADWQSSAKVDKTMEILQQIRNAGQGEKTIVFSSFTSFLDLVEVPLSRAADLGTYARYDGSMSANHRNEAVMTFTDNPNCKTILVSLKAGNAGLNLTAANHVVILDPFWNPFVENQAADRCYRIGQMREVTVHRVLIGGGDMPKNAEGGEGYTVEDRILALQERKRELVETALDEKAGQNVARLGVRELGYLFGVNSLR